MIFCLLDNLERSPQRAINCPQLGTIPVSRLENDDPYYQTYTRMATIKAISFMHSILQCSAISGGKASGIPLINNMAHSLG